MTSTSTIVLQQVTAEQDAALRDLSALDSARTITRPALMAFVDGRIVAAASLSDGRIVADPFAHTEAAVRLLRLRTTEIEGRRRIHPRRRVPGFSLRPRPAV
jgi:hypothetical protein